MFFNHNFQKERLWAFAEKPRLPPGRQQERDDNRIGLLGWKRGLRETFVSNPGPGTWSVPHRWHLRLGYARCSTSTCRNECGSQCLGSRQLVLFAGTWCLELWSVCAVLGDIPSPLPGWPSRCQIPWSHFESLWHWSLLIILSLRERLPHLASGPPLSVLVFFVGFPPVPDLLTQHVGERIEGIRLNTSTPS